MTAPLANVRVLDLGRYIAAPWAGQLLGDLGAEVIKIEQPGKGDPMRQAGPTFIIGPDGETTDLSTYMTAANRNKRSLTLDITHPEGRDILLQLVGKSQVMIENFRTGYLEANGLGFDVLRAHNPALILCSITGFGQSGPLAALPATDSLAQAMSGLMSVTGEPDGPPQKVGVTIIDVMTGIYASTAILAALRSVEMNGGTGQQIDLSLFDSAMAVMSHASQEWLISGKTPLRTGGLVNGAVPAQVFQTADGWINIQAQYDHVFPIFCDAIGLPSLKQEPEYQTKSLRWSHRERLLPLLQTHILEFTTQDLMARLTQAGVMAAPVLTVAQALELPQSRARGLRCATRRNDGVIVPFVRGPLRLEGMPEEMVAPPSLGEHSRDILTSLLGMKAEVVSRLQRTGVI